MKVILKVKEIRKRENITLRQLSKKSGVSSTHINNIEREVKEPSLLVIIKLAEALDKEITDLYYVRW